MWPAGQEVAWRGQIVFAWSVSQIATSRWCHDDLVRRELFTWPRCWPGLTAAPASHPGGRALGGGFWILDTGYTMHKNYSSPTVEFARSKRSFSSSSLWMLSNFYHSYLGKTYLCFCMQTIDSSPILCSNLKCITLIKLLKCHCLTVFNLSFQHDMALALLNALNM